MNKLLLLFVFGVVLHPGKHIRQNSTATQIVLLGTGTPFADPERSGPSVAIVVNNISYVIDCGPGVVRRASAAAKNGIKGLEASQLRKLFITHLHSDHTTGYPDFIFTPAVLDRNAPLEVYGPKGLRSMTDHIMQAYKEDMDIRINGLEYGNAEGYKVNVHEIIPGIIYKDSNITVKAFRVKHGSWSEAFGFRFETPDKVIVVSGDCTYSEELVANAKDCDILIHEVYSMEGLAKREKRWQNYHSTFHTSTAQLAEIANQVKPKILVLIHQLLFGSTEKNLLNEIKRNYSGKVINGKDLDIL
ncbi:MAG: MBL fold metallo-hydrolase [Sediminibacterium sp.]